MLNGKVRRLHTAFAGMNSRTRARGASASSVPVRVTSMPIFSECLNLGSLRSRAFLSLSNVLKGQLEHE